MAKYTKEQIRQYDETIAHLLKKVNEHGLPYTYTHVQQDVKWLHRQETTLHRIAENQCNGYFSAAGVHMKFQEAADLKKQERIEGRVRDLLALYHVPVRFEGDPRGGTIRMIFGDRISNNWGGEDWGIYW